jgi:hypothetical protein
MNSFEEVRANEKEILRADICGFECEIVEVDGVVLLYADGYFMGEIYAEETAEEYVEQVKAILE